MKLKISCLALLALLSFGGNRGECVPIKPKLKDSDQTLIREAFHLWKSRAGHVWPGSDQFRAPFLYVTPQFEFAIRFPETLKGFETLPPGSFDSERVQVRERKFNVNLAASFNLDGVQAVVIGNPSGIGREHAYWVLTAVHEMFHVYQGAHGSSEKLAALKIGPTSDDSWQLNFAFPYDDSEVMNLFHLNSYLNYLAVLNPNAEELKYQASCALDARLAYQGSLARKDPSGKAYDYSRFQEWDEGIALYTEYRVAELAISTTYHPDPGFVALAGSGAYQSIWDSVYENKLYLSKHAGRTGAHREEFYFLGLVEGLLLDRLNPGWKNQYFSPGVWLDELLAEYLRGGLQTAHGQAASSK